MSAPTSDLNLLFAVLALQNELVAKDTLLEAMTAWGLAKHRLLADILVERGGLPAEDRQLIDGLIERQLRRHATVASSLAAMPVAPAVKDQLQAGCPPDMEDSLAQLSTNGDPNRTRRHVSAPSIPGSERYRILRPHARGGLGEVFVAEDVELHREIALKQIQARHAGQATSRSRFILEAEITGRLEHPGVVPVYGLGSYADGRPFYAMRFIRGDTLKEAIARFHAPRPDAYGPDFGSLAFRQLLGRFVAVCNAVAYAHSRGVLHRDLKPGNIMLGKFGETLVVDWGLAKAVGRNLGSGETADHVDEGTLMPSSGSGLAETVVGSAIGTPSYMSPEQAAGRIDDLGPTTDVYSLGATFYTLLTNRLPVEASDTAGILHKVQRGEAGFADGSPVPRAIPAPLAAICRKAMMPPARDRYASPLAMAEDLEHWLADEPVTAYAEPWIVRAGRLVRRHRTAVTGAVAAIGVASVCLAVATVLLSAARESEREAKVRAQENELKAEQERDKARERFALARDAVDKYHTQVSDSQELRVAGLEQLRTRLLEIATVFYERFAKEDEADVSVEAERGHAYRRLAEIYQDTGQHADAERAFLQSLTIAQRLADAHPNDPTREAELAANHHLLGWLYQNTGKTTQAEEHHLRALPLWDHAVEALPDDVGHASHQANTYSDLGILYKDAGRLALAKDAFEKSMTIRSRLALAQPGNDRLQFGLQRSYTLLGGVYQREGNVAEAEKAHQQAVEIAQRLVSKYPSAPGYLESAAIAYSNLGFAYARARQREKAERPYLEALKLAETLVAAHPAVVAYQGELANTQNLLGNLYSDTGRQADADVSYKKALASFERLHGDYPWVTKYAVELGGVYCNRGRLLSAMNDLPAATTSLLDGKRILEAVISKDERSVAAQRYLLNVHSVLGRVHMRQGLKQGAEDAFRGVVQQQAILTQANPDSTEELLALGGAWCNYGHRLFTHDKFQPAIDAYSRAVETLDGLLRKYPEHRRNKQFLVNSLSGRGRTLSKGMGRHADALVDLDRALTLADDSNRGWLRVARARALACTGAHREAADIVREMDDKTSADYDALMDAARTHAVAAVVVRRDTKLDAAERDRLAEQYAAGAVELLSKAAARGRFNVPANRGELNTDSELHSLRMRPDFKKLLATLPET
jgi:eukaryotic-like serine/threonine-protein kinase